MVPATTVAPGEFRMALLLQSSAPEPAWAEGNTVWAVGSADPAAGTIEGDLFLAF